MSHMRKVAFTLMVLFTLCVTTRTAKLASSDQAPESQPAVTQKSKQGKLECTRVSGMVMTNFITEDTTLGPVTGDLKGAVSARILQITPGENGKLFIRIHHTFVTEAGDTIRSGEATAEATPISEGIYHVAYQPQPIVGGTGRFTGATGEIDYHGSADLTKGETVFRYLGEICTRR